MRYEVRPLGVWDRPVTEDRPYCRFRAPWSKTLTLLGRETDLLGAQLVVLQVDVTTAEIRLDGMLRANARVGFPGVKVSFESNYGPLTYATDRFDHWQDNVRAVALSLESLRAVDRYGATRSGEQYRGWSAIASTSGEFGMDRGQAANLLAHDTPYSAEDILADPKVAQSAFRAAALRHHPDRGGNPELFRRLKAARDLLIEKGF